MMAHASANPPAAVGHRVFVLIPTHTTRHLAAAMASLGHQTRSPDAVVLTCDVDLPEIADLAHKLWPTIQSAQRAAGRPVTPLWHAYRPHQGGARLNQVRNNGLRTLQSHAGAAGRDLVVVLDGDTLLSPTAIAQHAAARDAGADMVIAYRVMLTEEQTAAISADSIRVNGIPEALFLTPSEQQLLAARQNRYQRHHLWWRLGLLGLLGKYHKPKILGGHHSSTMQTSERINGFDEDFAGYRSDDDEYSGRANRLRPRVNIDIAVNRIMAYHLWHPTRGTMPRSEDAGPARFARRDLPIVAAVGLRTPRAQPEVKVQQCGSPSHQISAAGLP